MFKVNIYFNRGLSLVIRLYEISKQYPLKNIFFNKLASDADTYVFMPFIWSPTYLSGDNFIKDIAMVTALEKNDFKVSLIRTFKKFNFHDKNILFSLSKDFNVYGFSDHPSSVRYISKTIESEGFRVYPNYRESSFWENKQYMHEEFERLKIKCPVSYLINIKETTYDKIRSKVGHDIFLIKEVHSCSANGIYKVTSQTEFDSIQKQLNGIVIFQELIPMSKDLRVILVGDEIVLHYWRINKSLEWKPTSTGFGSEVDFDYFPEHHRDKIIETFKKLNITTGAFDICWRQDDISTEPLILEVSSYYQPNPKHNREIIEKFKYYGAWKKSLSIGDNSYLRRHVGQIFEIQKKIIIELKKNKRIFN